MPAPDVLITPSALQPLLNTPQLLLIDLSSEENYQNGHIAGAIRVDPARLLRGSGTVPNKLPTADQLSALMSEIGLTPEHHVVAYDDQMGALAGRFIWTLDVIGHHTNSVLDGQLGAWINQGYDLQIQPCQARPSRFEATIDNSLIADKAYLLAHLGDPSMVIWDARTAGEYSGEKVTNALKGGHIPGAKHFEWTQSLSGPHDWRIQNPEALKRHLASLGISPDKEVITHCQTHRRSGLTYLVAKALGYPRIRCYDGSWFEWGNDPDTPVETG
ncbi:MAG: rhodanese-like domain-containing protein [Motiliproteus sp.]